MGLPMRASAVRSFVVRVGPAVVLLLVAGCATLPPFRPTDPFQAVANEPSTAAATAEGVRMIVRTAARQGGRGDGEERLTPVEIAVQNASGGALEIRPAHFALTAPDGFRYEALPTEDVGRALGPAPRVYAPYGYWPYGPYPGSYSPWGSGWGFGPGLWVPAPSAPYGGGLPPRALAHG